MYKTGYELSDADISERYSRLGDEIDLPAHFYAHVGGLLAGLCAPGGRVLDVGCGNGRLLEQVAVLRPDLELRGFDVAWGSVHTSHTCNGGRWRVVQASGLHLPFGCGSFDVVSLVEVLEHVKQPMAALREVARLLRPGGRILISVPNLSAWSPFWRLAERSRLSLIQRIFLPSEHPLRTRQPIDTAYAYRELRELIDGAGLLVEAQHGRAFFPYLRAGMQVLRPPSAAPSAPRPDPSRAATGGWLTRTDALLERVLPARLGYRLSLECRPI